MIFSGSTSGMWPLEDCVGPNRVATTRPANCNTAFSNSVLDMLVAPITPDWSKARMPIHSLRERILGLMPHIERNIFLASAVEVQDPSR